MSDHVLINHFWFMIWVCLQAMVKFVKEGFFFLEIDLHIP